MNSEMMGRKHLFPRPFRAHPEETLGVGSCDPGLAAALQRLGLTPWVLFRPHAVRRFEGCAVAFCITG